jgi:large subunit ribosomal protein L25
MRETISLKAKVRDKAGKEIARKLRKNGRIPAIIYGRNTKPISLSVDEIAISKLFATEVSLTKLIELTIENGDEKPIKKVTMIKDVQVDPVKRNYIHIDFYEVRMDEKVSTLVKVRFLGKAKGVEEGGVFQHNLRELEISCLPDLIPEYIDVDISSLKIGDSIHVKDISLPEGIDMLTAKDQSLLTVLPPIVEEKEEIPEEEEAKEEEAEEEKAEEEKAEEKKG